MINPDFPIRYDFPAKLRKWPSTTNERVGPGGGASPYIIFEGTLDECIRQFLAKPGSEHHQYEITTLPQDAIGTTVLLAPELNEIFSRADFPVNLTNES
jgi:hypothetical protein